MSINVKLRKGFDINLAGKAEKRISTIPPSETFTVKPSDFIGLKKVKILVKEGETVKAGTPLFFDKENERVMFPSPVSGEVVAIQRGDKRKVEEIRILADREIQYQDFRKISSSEIGSLSKDAVTEALLASGTWLGIIQRPYGIIAKPTDTPKSIFISGFDTHPLAADYSYVFQGEEQYFQAGIEALRKLTTGKVHLNVNSEATPAIFANAKNVQINKFSGPHPAGNVGVQIHHIDPIGKGDVVWTVAPYHVIQIGKLLLDGRYDASKIIALVGSEVKNPQYYKVVTGSSIKNLIAGNIKSDNVRFVSGNVLTGSRISTDHSIGYYHNQLTVLPEGNQYDFLGWIKPTAKKISFHRAFGLFSFMNKKGEFVADTNMNGEERAFVVTGVFEKVTPMDLYPMQLIKAIMANDYDNMEALGIYEVIEEDLALCEFVDVSKHDIQAKLREGIEMLQNS